MEDRMIIIDKVKKYVKEKLEGEGTGHDWWHTIRTYNNAVNIAEMENELMKNEEKNPKNDINIFVVKLGALLHDVADHKFGYTDKDRRDIIENLLDSLGVKKEDTESVIYIANNISFRKGKNKHKMQTIEGMIVQDADRLEAIGAIGIGRTFAYGGSARRVMYDPEDRRDIEEREDSISHFYEKLLLLKDRMNTRAGYEKALKRHKFMENFLEEFYNEWEGK